MSLAYIQDIIRLKRLAAGLRRPSRSQLEAALRGLATSPVQGYPPFTYEIIRLIGQYRCAFGHADSVWATICQGGPDAWLTAVHEAAELDAFQKLGANPFDVQSFQIHFEQAHIQAVEVEIAFLIMWAKQQGVVLSEAAMEATNPKRNFGISRYALTGVLTRRYGWAEPTDKEMAEALRFWKYLLEEERG